MIIVVILVVVVGYVAVCAFVGLQPTNAKLAGFESEVGPIVRHFHQLPVVVIAAYREAASRTPGMTVRDAATDSLLIDLRPTSRILGGNFGLAIRVRATSSGSGAQVITDGQNKVPMALFANHGAALVHAERALRMNAKRRNLTEVVNDPAQ